MSCSQRSFISLVVGIFTWWLVSNWYINASECFYFSVPVVTLVFYLTGQFRDPGTVPALSLHLPMGLRNGVAMFAAVLIVGVCSMSWVFGPRVLHSWKYWLEFVTVFYLIAAVFLVIFGFLYLLLKVTERLARTGARTRILVSAAALSLFVLLAVPFAVAFSFVYRVKLPNVADPQTDLGRAYEDVEFACADGTLLAGWWVPARSPSSRTILFCHGLAANRTQTLKFHEIGNLLQANLFLFDMRGHGDSAGRAGAMGLRERDDVFSAITHVRQKWPNETRQLLGMGVSLGAAVLADVAAEVEPPLDGLILDSGFSATGNMTHSLPHFFRGWLLTVGLPIANWNAGCTITDFRPEASISRVRAPVVLLHARHDWITPSEQSVRLYERAVEPKQLVILDVEGHTNAYFDRPQEYLAAIRKFAERLPK